MADVKKLEKELYKDLLTLGDGIKDGLWNDQNKQFLQQIASDIASLTAKIVRTDDETKKKRYQRSIDLLKNHVTVMGFSRLNVVEKEVSAVARNLLEKAVGFLIKAALSSIGIPSP